MRALSLIVCLMFATFAYAQDEDECKDQRDYWSEDHDGCFLVGEMDFDAHMLWTEIQKQQAEKDRLQHQQQEYNASGKAVRKQNFDVQIARFEARRDATNDDGLKETYQRKIDQLVQSRDYHDDYNVTEHGPKISALSQSIGKHKEELDSLLQ